MSLMCTTNTMTDMRSCTIKGEHQIVCDGWAYRWNPDKDRMETSGKECKGCLPSEARQGMLCWNCWEDVQAALGGYDLLAQKLRGIDRAIQRDNGGIRTQSLGIIPIPAVRLMLDELWGYTRKMPANPILWVSSEQGAKDAIRFARAFRSAVRNHPTEETAHRVKRTRCTGCQQLTLVWNPVTRIGGQVQVKCSNPECLLAMDQTSFEAIPQVKDTRKSA